MNASMIFGGVTVSAEGDAKEVFGELAGAAEVFGQNACGACGSELTVPVVREVEGNTYYEMRCQSCGACLAFGQRRQDGKLFPRRKKDENWLPNRGWVNHRAAKATTDESPF
jgi:hypothetical protein